MSKTPEEMAEEYAAIRSIADESVVLGANPWTKAAFLAGYKAAKEEANFSTPAKWISVKDRLPEINKGFISFAENKEVCNCYRYPDHSEDGRPVFYAQTKTGLLICGLESISHWMPLPKAPKEEK